MPTTLIFAENNERLPIDACFSQSHSRTAEVTEHPVEDGGVVSDHIQNHPEELTLTGIFTATPIKNILDAFGDPNHHVKAFERIQKAWDKGETLSVLTGLQIYNDMAITDFTPTREVATGFSVPFSLTLRHVEKVTAQTALVPKSAFGNPHVKAKAAKHQRKGRKPKNGAKPGIEAFLGL